MFTFIIKFFAGHPGVQQMGQSSNLKGKLSIKVPVLAEKSLWACGGGKKASSPVLTGQALTWLSLCIQSPSTTFNHPFGEGALLWVLGITFELFKLNNFIFENNAPFTSSCKSQIWARSRSQVLI